MAVGSGYHSHKPSPSTGSNDPSNSQSSHFCNMDNDSNDNDGDEVLEEEAAEDDVQMQKPRQQVARQKTIKQQAKATQQYSVNYTA